MDWFDFNGLMSLAESGRRVINILWLAYDNREYEQVSIDCLAERIQRDQFLPAVFGDPRHAATIARNKKWLDEMARLLSAIV